MESRAGLADAGVQTSEGGVLSADRSYDVSLGSAMASSGGVPK